MAPNSPNARPSERMPEDSAAGKIAGKNTVRNVRKGPAAKVIAASSSAGSISVSTGSTARTTNGNVTNSSPRTMPVGAKMISKSPAASLLPMSEVGPYKVANMTPATRVGTARGKSTKAESNARPGILYLTSTQAVAVPKTVLISATTNDVHAVSQRALSATMALLYCTKLAQPP